MIEALQNWARILIITAAAGCTINIIMPEGGSKKYVKFACGVAAVCVMAAPFGGLISYISSLAVSEPALPSGYADYSAEALAETREWILLETAGNLQDAINDSLYSEYGFYPDSVQVILIPPEDGSEKISVRSVTVYYDRDSLESAAGKPAEQVLPQIQAYLRTLLNYDSAVATIK